LLLGVLGRGPRHGYAVIADLRDRTEGALDLSEGTVYPALHRLQDNGLLASDWQDVAGRRRRIYRLTEQGTRALSAEAARWRSFTSSVEAVLRVRPVGPTTPTARGVRSPRRPGDFAGWQA
jgi:DNA-binding PadR family transcriptional regulator